jgi:hypothetical protein
MKALSNIFTIFTGFISSIGLVLSFFTGIAIYFSLTEKDPIRPINIDYTHVVVLFTITVLASVYYFRKVMKK